MLGKQSLNALSLIVIVICCTSVPAQTRTPAPNAVAPASSEEPTIGSISGSVVNEGGQPLAGVRVTVREFNPGGSGRIASTDAEGKFHVDGLGPGLYFVSASSPAYVTQPTDAAWPFNHYRIGDSVKIEMVRGGVITGTVTNANGEPVIGVGVRAIMIRNAKGESPNVTNVAYLEKTTDDRGIYRLFGLPGGTYLVSAGGATNSQRFLLNRYDSDLPTFAPSSNRDTAAEITLRAGEELNADIRYRGETGHVISGMMKMIGSSNGSLSLSAAGSPIPLANAFQMPGTRGFEFSGIADGEYDVIATEITSPPPGGQQPEFMTSEPKRVVVRGADVTGLELIPRPLASITGRVVLEPAKVAACEGKRRPEFVEMLLTLQRPDRDSTDKENLPFWRSLPSAVSPDANGGFALRNLPPGRYLFDPRFYARYWYLHSISIAATPKTDPAANWTALKFGDQISNVTITLAEGAASIRGRLKSVEKTDIPSGFGVYLIPAETEMKADVLRYFMTPLQEDGTFALNNLPPGRYLTLVQQLDAQTNTLAKLRLPESAETRAKLRRTAESQKMNLELKPCQNLTDFQLSIKQ
jgi:hypothetical protein